MGKAHRPGALDCAPGGAERSRTRFRFASWSGDVSRAAYLP